MSLQIPGVTPLDNVEEIYPGSPLKPGDNSQAVLYTKNALNAISVNYTAIPRIAPVTTQFDESMEAAVKQFQRIFNLPDTGIVDKATWYEIRKIFSAVRKLAVVTAEAPLAEEIPKNVAGEIEDLEVVPQIQLLQYFLNVLSAYYESIPAVDINGMLDSQTRKGIMEFQKTFGLPLTGLIDDETWTKMYSSVEGILRTIPPSAIALPALLYPPEVFREGSEGPDVYIMQQYLLFISSVMPDIPPVIPDGIFGPDTTKAVIAFQTLYGMEPNGIIDENTWDGIVGVYRQLRFSEVRPTGQFPGSVIG